MRETTERRGVGQRRRAVWPQPRGGGAPGGDPEECPRPRRDSRAWPGPWRGARGSRRQGERLGGRAPRPPPHGCRAQARPRCRVRRGGGPRPLRGPVGGAPPAAATGKQAAREQGEAGASESGGGRRAGRGPGRGPRFRRPPAPRLRVHAYKAGRRPPPARRPLQESRVSSTSGAPPATRQEAKTAKKAAGRGARAGAARGGRAPYARARQPRARGGGFNPWARSSGGGGSGAPGARRRAGARGRPPAGRRRGARAAMGGQAVPETNLRGAAARGAPLRAARRGPAGPRPRGARDRGQIRGPARGRRGAQKRGGRGGGARPRQRKGAGRAGARPQQTG